MSLLLLTSPGVFAAGEASLEAGMINPGYHEKPAWFKESFLDLNEDVLEAKREGKRLLLYFYQDGCPYCSKLLQDNFGQKPIADKTRKHFNTIAINMWGDREVTDFDGSSHTEKSFAEARKVMFTPTLLFLNEQGEVALRVNGYYHPDKFNAALDYVSGRHETKLAFNDYYAKRTPVKASGKLHDQPFIIKPPYDLSKIIAKDDKPLLIIFEQKVCQDCDEMHTDIFKRKETLEQLARLHVVRLDMWSKDPIVTPAGKKTTAESWAREMNVQYAPSLVFLDNQGKEIIRTEAYLKSFHTQSIMDYASSGAYKQQPNFQRFIGKRAEDLEAQGVHVDLMN
ncbi:MAG: thioredoxin fold domain-containing protein [Gammaproteobacteria bacterium]